MAIVGPGARMGVPVGITMRFTLSSLLGNHLVFLISPMTRRLYSSTAGTRMGVPVGAVDIDRRWRLERERERGLAQSSPPSPTTEQSPDSRRHGGANAPNTYTVAAAHGAPAELGWH